MEEENSEDMLHIILFILKIIGIILASIIGLLLFVILVVLLVPIKYRVAADKKEDLTAEAKITWLFRLLYLHISFKDNHYKMRFRILGKVFYDSDATKDKNKRKKSKRRKKGKGSKEGKIIVKRIGKDKKSRKNIKRYKTNKRLENNDIILKHDKDAIVVEHIEKSKNIAIEKSLEKSTDDIQPITIVPVEESVYIVPVENVDEKDKNISYDITKDKRNTHTIKEKEIHVDVNLDYTNDSFDNYSNKNNEFPVKTIMKKIISCFEKIKTIFNNIKNFFLNINTTIQKIKEFFLNINEKWDKIKDFFNDEINKLGLSKSLRSLYKVLKHLHPKKLKIEIEIGTGDPCSTGQVVGLLAVFYGYFGENVQIIPNFETSILEGSIFCLGRIRIATLLIICIKLIVNDHFKQLIKNMKAFKEEL